MFVISGNPPVLPGWRLSGEGYAVRYVRFDTVLPEELTDFSKDINPPCRIKMLVPVYKAVNIRTGDCRYHRGLPPFIVPFKHYSAADIQSGVEKGVCGDVGAEESTIRRWQAWFAAILSAIVSMQIHEDEIRGMETGMNDAYNRYRELHGPFWLVFFIKTSEPPWRYPTSLHPMSQAVSPIVSVREENAGEKENGGCPQPGCDGTEPHDTAPAAN